MGDILSVHHNSHKVFFQENTMRTPLTPHSYILTVAPLVRIALTRDQAFSYTARRAIATGALVSIPVGKRIVHGIVLSCTDATHVSTASTKKFTLKPIRRVLKEPCLTAAQITMAQFISTYYLCPLGIVLPHYIPHRVRWRTVPPSPDTAHRPGSVRLTPAQKACAATITSATPTARHFFLHAYTQIDKMSILIHVLQRLFTQSHGQALYLVPELMHVPAIEAFFSRFFPQTAIAVVHGKLSKGAYDRIWEGVRDHTIRIVIGTRRAIFLPFHTLAMIIVDEAHDNSHKQWEHYPLFDARTVVRHLALHCGATLIFTSATPRIIDHADTTVHTLTLPQPSPPRIIVVDMKKERWDKNTSPLSRTLVTQIGTMLTAKKKVLIFVNRQGESAFAVCSACRRVAHCPTCARTLMTLTPTLFFCPQCRVQSVAHTCHHCHKPWTHVGIGTARIRRALAKIFPTARYAIADATTMKKSGAYEKLYRDFTDGEIDILIGTQMITKGWSTASIGLSVIIDMDNLLSFPSYDVNEKAFAFILQMALRAHSGTLLIQTFQPENRVLTQACAFDVDGFIAAETDVRTVLAFPPAASLIRMLYRHADPGNVRATTAATYADLIAIAATEPSLRISEPHVPLIAQQRGKHRMQIIIKNTAHTHSAALRAYLATKNMPWTIDIDPVQTI